MAGDEDVVARPDVPAPADGDPAESANSAADAELSESIGIDRLADDGGVATPPTDGTAPGDTPPAAGTPKAKRRKKEHRKAPWWELPVLIAVAIAVAVLIKTFLIQPFYIPSESMEPTLHGCAGCSGDRILVNKPIYSLRDPHPGDIVVFRAPTDVWFNEPYPAPPSNPILKGFRWFGQLVGVVPPDEHDLVKRVIATGGQTVQGLANGTVQVSQSGPNGPWHTLNEPYIQDPLTGQDAVFGPVTVPKGRLWVMGDNRAHSDDSRYHYEYDYKGDAVMSTVPVSDVIGKAVIIAWPPSRWRTLGTPATFKHEFATAGAALPAVAWAAVVLPVFAVRRRRRRLR